MKLPARLRHPLRTLDAWWAVKVLDDRLDRHPLMLCVLMGLWGPSLAIVLVGPVPSSVLEGMPEFLQIVMCGFIVIGCLGMMHASALGSRWYFYATRRKAYQRAYTAAPLAVSGLFVYGGFILANTGGNVIAALSGILTPFLGLGLFLTAVLYWLEDRRIERNEPAVVAEIKAQSETDDG